MRGRPGAFPLAAGGGVDQAGGALDESPGQARDVAIAALTEAFSKDRMELDELESRLAKVQSAETVTEIRALVADLAPVAVAPVVLAVVPAAQVEERQTAMSILGSTERRGIWTSARRLKALSVLGSTVLDFREARLPAGVVEVQVNAVLGSVEIIVPPELAVEVQGTGILGSFESVDRAPAEPDPARPLLRIRGSAVLGSVEVQTRLPDGDRAQRDPKKLGSG